MVHWCKGGGSEDMQMNLDMMQAVLRQTPVLIAGLMLILRLAAALQRQNTLVLQQQTSASLTGGTTNWRIRTIAS